MFDTLAWLHRWRGGANKDQTSSLKSFKTNPNNLCFLSCKKEVFAHPKSDIRDVLDEIIHRVVIIARDRYVKLCVISIWLIRIIILLYYGPEQKHIEVNEQRT